MTTITFYSPAPSTHSTAHGIVSGLVASFSEFCAGARDGKAIEIRYRSYARLSQPQLAELGMTRSDIYRAALIGRPV
jgi:hypothetical protein